LKGDLGGSQDVGEYSKDSENTSIGEGIPNREAAWVAQIVQSHIIENWEAQDEPEHLKTIRDRILREEKAVGLLGLYQQVLQQGEVGADNGSERQTELRLSGLVVRRRGRLVAANRIYRKSWV
jgi:hypothetical protein